MAPRFQIGDVFEIRTPCGLAYVQYSHEHDRYGELVRVLPGLYPRRPGDLKSIVEGHRFFVFYPVRAAAKHGDAELVQRLAVPEAYQGFPLMRWALGGDGARYGWVLWDGHREVGRRKRLSEAESHLPENEVWTHGLVVERVASDWSWADTTGPIPWPTPPRASPCYDVGFTAEADHDQGLPGEVRHFVSFARRASATAAADRLRQAGMVVEVRDDDASARWLAIITADVEDERIIDLTEDLGGDYEGSETRVG